MTNQDWKLIFADDIVINFTFKKNGVEIPLEYRFKQPTEDAQLELMTGITHLDKLTDYIANKDTDLEAMGGMEEKELLAKFGKDKDLILATTELKIGYLKMMAKHFIKGSGWNKKKWKNFEVWYNSLEGVIRTRLYEDFMNEINDEKKTNSIEILSDSTTME